MIAQPTHQTTEYGNGPHPCNRGYVYIQCGSHHFISCKEDVTVNISKQTRDPNPEHSSHTQIKHSTMTERFQLVFFITLQ